MAKNVRIQSSRSITVTSGLQYQDVTNPDAHIPDRLKVSPSWPKNSVMIKRGVGLYPVEIKSWKTVQALARDGILTIGEEVDDDSEGVAKIKTENVKSVKKSKSLEEISE